MESKIALNILEKWFPTPEGSQETNLIIQAMEEYATLKAQQGSVTLKQIEDEITKRWNSIQFNPEGVKKREDLRIGVLNDLGIPIEVFYPTHYQELKERYDNIAKEHSDLNLALAAMLNGYQNLSMYQKGWFPVPKDLIDAYTKMVLAYDNPGNCKGEKEGEAVEIMKWALDNIKTWYGDLDYVTFHNGENCRTEELHNEYLKQKG